MLSRTRRHLTVVGADALTQQDQPVLIWAVDATREVLRAVLRRRQPALFVDDEATASAAAVAWLGRAASKSGSAAIIAIACWGAYVKDAPVLVRVGTPVSHVSEEAPTAPSPTVMVDRVIAEVARLRREQEIGWWESLRSSDPVASAAASTSAVGGWRLAWRNSEPPAAPTTIWPRA